MLVDMRALATVRNADLELKVDSLGWHLTSSGLSLRGFAVEVYGRSGESSGQLFSLNPSEAKVEEQQVEVPGLGRLPGLVCTSERGKLVLALGEALLLQLELKVQDDIVEHFCLPFEVQGDGEVGTVQRQVTCCTSRWVRPAEHSSLLVNGWQSFSFSGALHGTEKQPQTCMPFFSAAFHQGAALPAGCPAAKDPNVLVSDLYGHYLQHGDNASDVLGGFLAQKAGFGGLAVTSTLPAKLTLFSELQPGPSLSSDWAYLSLQKGGSQVQQKYFDTIMKHHQLRPCKPQPVGWCSWYCHGPNVDELLMQQSLEELKSLGLDSGELALKLFQLDDGWQKMWGDWTPNAKFPNGLKPLTAAVREAGLLPGIWLAPAALVAGSKVAKEHPEWILRDEYGKVVSGGFTAPGLWMRGLDTTIPEVIEHIESLIRTIVHEWGFGYLKCDFLHLASLPGKRHDPRCSRAEALTRLMAAVRRAAGPDVFILACGAPLGPCVGLADAIRVSADTAPHWLPVGPDIPGTRWMFAHDRTNLPSARNMVCSTMARLQMSGRLWVNDPDCMILREKVALHEARALASVVALSAGSVIFSDALHLVPKERLEILKALLPPLPRAAELPRTTCQEIPHKMMTSLSSAVGSWQLCGLFAWDEAELQHELEDQDCHVFEFWSSAYTRHKAADGSFRTGPMAARSCRLLALRPLQARPQMVGSNIHVSCGMEVTSWEAAAQSLSFTINVQRRIVEPQVWIYLPGAKNPRCSGAAQEVYSEVWRFSLPEVPKNGASFQIDW
ncbi:unnamed protein product [Effrenium voratum]|nr:unnamed protein product [Effrenium voratum]